MKILYFLIFSLYSFISLGQPFKIQTEVIYGSYDMSDLKLLQKDMATNFGDIQLAELESFPAYFGYRLAVLTQFRGGSFTGIFGSYNSTGGRVYYEDYSGKLIVDNIVKSFCVGIKSQYIFENNIFVDGQIGNRFNVYDQIYELELKEYQENETYTFTANALSVDAGVGYRIPIRFISLLARVGGEITPTSSQFHVKKDSNRLLFTSDRKPVFANWSGWRFSLIIELKTGKNN